MRLPESFIKSSIYILHQDIVIVIYFHLLDNSLDWINRKIPALDNLKPIECLEDEIFAKRLKVLLMRFP